MVSLPQIEKIKSLLFICTGNCARSIMAEALTKHALKNRPLDLQVDSAGTEAKSGMVPTENTRTVLEQHGILADSHKAKICTKEMIERADLLLVMERSHHKTILSRYPDAKNKLFLLTDFCPDIEPWIQESGIPDPLGMNLEFYSNICHLIERSCLGLLEKNRPGAESA